MRFLIISHKSHPIPQEAAIPILEAMREWVKRHTASKKLEQVFNFAGLLGGGGIANVNSPEELDAIMAEYPINMFVKTEIYALTDSDRSFVNSIEAVKKMLPPKR